MKILSFDIEDWWIYEKSGLGNKDQWLPRLDNYLNEILDLLDNRNFKATFFLLGEVAECAPNVIKLIASRGHHIGCHSYSHKFWKENSSRKEVEEDTRRAIGRISEITGQNVNAYRAPAFSITEKNSWILEVLAENGIEYDCSIFPAARSFGGFADFSAKVPSIIQINGYKLKEFPISPANILGKEIVYSGGGYFRLFPYWKIKSLAKQSEYLMTYFHLKDFDWKQKKVYRSLDGESALIRHFKNYYGLKNSFPKFRHFISDFEFLSVEQADRIIKWEEAPRIVLSK